MSIILFHTAGKTGYGDDMMPRALWMLICCLILTGSASAANSTSDFMNVLPPVVNDTTKAEPCTVTYLVTDVTTNDMLAVRMQITPDPNDRPTHNLMPCPSDIPPRMASRALDACTIRAAEPRNCVFGDMGRGFEKQPKVDSTAENYSRCASDKATDIGVACWRSGKLDVCNIACGNSPPTAVAAAVERCQVKQQQQCPITGSLPVLAPR